MKNQYIIKIRDKINYILDNSIISSRKDIITCFIISLIYTIISLIDSLSLGNSFDFSLLLVQIFSILLFYLPEVIIIILDYLIKKINIKNQDIIKILRIIIKSFNIIYFIFFGLIILILIYLRLDL